MDRRSIWAEYQKAANEFAARLADIDRKYGTYVLIEISDVDATTSGMAGQSLLRSVSVQEITLQMD
jgi:hypothetical protein